MSKLRVEVVKVDDVQPIANAERLELATISGWQCVVGKGQFAPGDTAIYIPIDAVLPADLESTIFDNAKVKLNNGRVRTIKLRGVISQGLLIDFAKAGLLSSKFKVGDDVAETLKITKYEPPESGFATLPGTGPKSVKKKHNPDFKKYTDLQNSKWYPNLFIPGEEVVASEKIHGSNGRVSMSPTPVNTLWKKIKKWLGVLPSHEFCWGSHNCQLQEKGYNGYYSGTINDIYKEFCVKYDLKNKIKPGEQFFGEVYGAGVQKNFSYGCGPNERKFVIFDICRDGKFLDHDEVIAICKDRDLPMVPVLYRGPYDNKVIESHVFGASVIAPSQKVREGLVLKPIKERHDPQFGRVILKYISPDYLLLKDNTDNH